jgi:hypothetical protein
VTVKVCSPARNLNEFLARIKEVRNDWPPSIKTERRGDQEDLWFRGQHSEGWGLSPKLYRAEYRGAQEAEIRQEFQSRALQLMQGRVPSREDKWEWYFLMQHYGAPTRLLDWTDNALVALYFAVHDQPEPYDAAVWVLDPWWLNRKLRKGIDGPMLPGWQEAEPYLWNLEDAFVRDVDVDVRRVAAIDPPHVDRRLAVQRSRFLIFGKSMDLTRMDIVKEKDCRLARIILPKKSIATILDELVDCGLTVSAVFPDLEHLCAEIADRWQKFTGLVHKTKGKGANA